MCRPALGDQRERPIAWSRRNRFCIRFWKSAFTAAARLIPTWCAINDRTIRYSPWGISESGYFAFDSQLNYQYKAHGVQALAAKQGMDRECVVSPYSSFLALPFDPHSGMENLRRLEQLGSGIPRRIVPR